MDLLRKYEHERGHSTQQWQHELITSEKVTREQRHLYEQQIEQLKREKLQMNKDLDTLREVLKELHEQTRKGKSESLPSDYSTAMDSAGGNVLQLKEELLAKETKSLSSTIDDHRSQQSIGTDTHRSQFCPWPWNSSVLVYLAEHRPRHCSSRMSGTWTSQRSIDWCSSATLSHEEERYRDIADRSKSLSSSRCFEWHCTSISSFTPGRLRRYRTTCSCPSALPAFSITAATAQCFRRRWQFTGSTGLVVISTPTLASDRRSSKWQCFDIGQSPPTDRSVDEAYQMSVSLNLAWSFFLWIVPSWCLSFVVRTMLQ